MPLRDLFLSGDESGKSFEKKLQRIGLVLLVLYLLAGVIYSAVLPAVARFSDEDEYLKLSYNLVHGPGYSMDGVNLTACRPPGYAFFLAGIRALGGGFLSFRVAQFLLLVRDHFSSVPALFGKKGVRGTLRGDVPGYLLSDSFLHERHSLPANRGRFSFRPRPYSDAGQGEGDCSQFAHGYHFRRS